MYAILVYDIKDPSRLNRVHKICGKYLYWIQNSVFEGEIRESSFAKMVSEIRKEIDSKQDSVITFQFQSVGRVERRVIGVEKNEPNSEIW